MGLKLYNTFTRQKEDFLPLKEGCVRFYACGPTVYNRVHVGNARSSVIFDVVFRVLKFLYGDVIYVRNITDIDDKILKACTERGLSLQELTQNYTTLFQEDMKALGNLSPTHEPKATDHLPQMIGLIEKLIERGHAYEAAGHVLFHVSSYKDYGKLSNRDPEEMLAGARVEVAPYKKNPGDFVLWKPSLPGEVGFDSPFSYGRPGWHIECSAMSYHYLGEVFDIHGGGIDLLFPHHENELAQSCCAFGHDLMARFWIHNGLITVNGEKMSKSLGNTVTVEDALAQLPGEVIRLMLLSAHYRQPLNWTQVLAHQSHQVMNRLYTALRDAKVDPLEERIDSKEISNFEEILQALEDDLNIPLVVFHLHEFAAQAFIGETLEEKRKAARKLLVVGRLLGFFQNSLQDWFHGKGAGDDALSSQEIEEWIEKRNLARGEKDFPEADRIRALLQEQGIVLEDAQGQTVWRKR